MMPKINNAASVFDCTTSAEKSPIEQEYFDLFLGVGQSELVPYGSYYLTGFLHEKPLARLREIIGGLEG